MQIVTSPPKKIMDNFLFFACFWSVQQQQQNFGWEQALWIFKHVVGLLVDPFNWWQLHISYNKQEKLFLRSLITKKFVTICLVTWGMGIMKKVTNCDKGGRGFKIWHFCGDVIFD